VFVADDHREVVAAATVDGAAPDTRGRPRHSITASRAHARAMSNMNTYDPPPRPACGECRASERSS
jgi:hypothetical protein